MVQQRILQKLIILLLTGRVVQQESQQQFIKTVVQLPKTAVGIFQDQLRVQLCWREQVQYWRWRVRQSQDLWQ